MIIECSLLGARTHGQKGTQICDPLANKCPDSVSKPGKSIWRGDIYFTVRDIYLRRRVISLTGSDIHLTGRAIYFEKGHKFVTNYLGG